MGPLVGWRADHDTVEIPKFAVMTDWLLGVPKSLDAFQTLVKPLGAFRRGYAKTPMIDLVPAPRDPELDSPPAQNVERGDVLGQSQRIVEWKLKHRKAQPQALGPSGQIRQKRNRRQTEPVFVDKMLLVQPDRLKSEQLRLFDQRETLVQIQSV